MPAAAAPGRPAGSAAAAWWHRAASARPFRATAPPPSGEQQLYRSGCARSGTTPCSTTFRSALPTASSATRRGNSTSITGPPPRRNAGLAAAAALSGRSSMTSAPRCSRGDDGAAFLSAAKAASCAAGTPASRAEAREVRRQAEIGDTALALFAQHRHRLLHAAGAVVDAGQEVRVEVDHARAISACRILVAKSCSCDGSASAWASSASVTSASAASRSSAAPRPSG